jgi:hypothetical protein
MRPALHPAGIWRTDDGMFIDDGWGATGQSSVSRSGRVG